MKDNKLRILQINLNRSIEATESVLQLAIEMKIDIIAVQEPWILGSSLSPRDFTGENRRSVNHQSFLQILPEGNIRPRVMLYSSRELQAQISTSPSLPPDPDCLLLSIQINGFGFQLLNIYEEASLQEGLERTIPRAVLPFQVQSKTIVLGDFNTHHPWWDPFSPMSSNATLLAKWFEENNLELLNTPGDGTFCRSNQRESVLDLSLVSQDFADRVEDWNMIRALAQTTMASCSQFS